MLSRILRIASVLEFAAGAALAAILIFFGMPTWIALVIGVSLPFLLHALVLGIEFITGALIDRRPLPRLNPLAAIRVWLVESWRSFVVFTIDQPWRADFPERRIVRDPNRPAVLMVHGYACNRAAWRAWLVDGIPAHWNVATVSLEPVYGAIEAYADALNQAVERLRAESGAEEVTLVCHSMGGLAARAYLRAYSAGRVGRVITIDTPHHGTLFARFSHGLNTRQMRRASDYVRDLASCDEPVEFVCFASQHDNLIVPRESQVLTCAEAIWFERVGHIAMIADKDVLAKLIEVVQRPMRRIEARQLEMNAAH